ncbi:hypothetical protein [Burkholderia territorii]|uniref:hypothetical protein n=2 Tax=Burkholderia cepacia complex TaxID=87882 RepID=UPI000A645344|nr:hypothetical protein [Burkholderia territorii]
MSLGNDRARMRTKTSDGVLMDLKRPISIVTGIFVVFLISVGGATSVGKKAYDSALMASWLQAIGSVAAIVGALWIAFRQTRIEYDAKLDAARITAIGMAERVGENAKELAEIVEKLKVAGRHDCDPNFIRSLASALSSLRKWSTEEELKVIPLGERCAANLALSRDRLHLSALDVSSFIITNDIFDTGKRKTFATKLADQLVDVPTMLQHAVEVCKESAKRL